MNPDTVFANILITDGAYSGYSSDAQVAAELTDMYANDDTLTYVIGFGDGISAVELTRMACWGSGGAGVPNCAGGIHYSSRIRGRRTAHRSSALPVRVRKHSA